jgi:3-methyl-2-oxobutanoate hydroxymethyltransferase
MSGGPAKITAPAIRARKGSGPAIVALTAYDFPTAVALDEAGVDLILVGDSLGMVVLGHDTTLPVDMDVMVHHTAAVARAKPAALLVADMPFLSCSLSREEAIRNAGRLIREGGAEAVKVEGGMSRLEVIRGIVEADIPVMGHLGLTPQAYHAMGGFRVQGRSPDAVRELCRDLEVLEEAGVFSVVLEGIPGNVARSLTASCAIPTIGIGAGPHCDGQILVTHDILGMSRGPLPKFVRRYANISGAMVEAVRSFAGDVTSGRFPGPDESYGEGASRGPVRVARRSRPA